MPIVNHSNPALYLKLPAWLLAILALVALFKFGMQLWIADKGMDMHDTSIFIFFIEFYTYYPHEPHGYYAGMFNWLLPFQPNYINLRLLTAVAEVVGITFFSASFFYWVRAQKEPFFVFHIPSYALIVLAFIGAAYTSVFTNAFSYNDFSYHCTLLCTGLLFLVFRQPRLSTRYKIIALGTMVPIGLLLGLQFFLKPTVLVLVLFWIAAFFIIYLKEKWWFKLAALSIASLTTFGFILVYIGGLDGLVTWANNYAAGVKVLKEFIYDPKVIILQGYLQVDLVQNSKYYLLPLLVAGIGFYLLSRYTAMENAVKSLVVYVLGLGVWLVLSVTVEQYFLGHFFNRFIAFHWYNILFFGVPFGRRLVLERKWFWFIMLLMLFILPFMPIAGSNQPTTETLTKYLGAWYVIIVLALGARFAYRPRVHSAFVAIIVLVCVANYVWVQLLNPFGIRGSVFAQTEQVQGLLHIDGLKMDKETARFMEQARDAVKPTGYQAGGPILALGDFYGVVAALGGYIPETFAYYSAEKSVSAEQSMDYSCLHLNNLRIGEHPRLPLIMYHSSIPEKVMGCLQASEIPYPENYYLASTIFDPYVQESLTVWAPYHWELPATYRQYHTTRDSR